MEKEKKVLPKNSINIELDAEILEGIYSNLVVISHSDSEFVFDFVRIVPGVEKAKVKSRMILSPENAKRLLRALNENISKYESSFGQIVERNGIRLPLEVFGQPGQA